MVVHFLEKGPGGEDLLPLAKWVIVKGLCRHRFPGMEGWKLARRVEQAGQNQYHRSRQGGDERRNEASGYFINRYPWAALPDKRDQSVRAVHVLPVRVSERLGQGALLNGDAVQEPDERDRERGEQAGPVGQGQPHPQQRY